MFNSRLDLDADGRPLDADEIAQASDKALERNLHYCRQKILSNAGWWGEPPVRRSGNSAMAVKPWLSDIGPQHVEHGPPDDWADRRDSVHHFDMPLFDRLSRCFENIELIQDEQERRVQAAIEADANARERQRQADEALLANLPTKDAAFKCALDKATAGHELIKTIGDAIRAFHAARLAGEAHARLIVDAERAAKRLGREMPDHTATRLPPEWIEELRFISANL